MVAPVSIGTGFLTAGADAPSGGAQALAALFRGALDNPDRDGAQLRQALEALMKSGPGDAEGAVRLLSQAHRDLLVQVLALASMLHGGQGAPSSPTSAPTTGAPCRRAPPETDGGRGTASPQPAGAGGVMPSGPTGSGSADQLVRAALSQQGAPYQWGASGGGAFDCSGLVNYAAKAAGLGPIPRTADGIAEYCQRNGTLMSVEQAMRTKGAILWKPGHIAISMGDGQHVVEAGGRTRSTYGTNCVGVTARGGFAAGGMLPGLA